MASAHDAFEVGLSVVGLDPADRDSSIPEQEPEFLAVCAGS
jgi:hypothetical protein